MEGIREWGRGAGGGGRGKLVEMPQRSRGVTILAWLAITVSLLNLFAFVFAVLFQGASRAGTGLIQPMSEPVGFTILTLGRGVSLAQALLSIVVAWVAWYVLQLREWARKWIIWLSGFKAAAVAVTIPYAFQGVQGQLQHYNLNPSLWWMFFVVAGSLDIAIPLLYLIFFMRPNVKAQFRGGK